MAEKRKKKGRFAFKNSIAMRWMFNSLSIIGITLVAVFICLVLAVQSLYYGGVRQQIRSTSSILNERILQISDPNTTLPAQLRSMVENFSDRDLMELSAIDASGQAVFTSSGFTPETAAEMPDYLAAMSSETGEGEFVGTIGGEKIMAISVLLPVANPNFTALRYVVSLSSVDGQIAAMAAAFGVICALIFLLIFLSGSYFVRSIVRPVRQISATARSMAGGDFNVRLEKQHNDEIGELCEAVNDMAAELATTENMKNEFISSVSHELRTPLTAIKGWGETLMQSAAEDADTRRRGLKIIIGETERLSEMVEELLDFSRMQSGRFTLLTAPVDLVAELTDSVLMFAERAKREGIALDYQEPAFVAVVEGDRNRLRQVFINILDNAIKYSDAPGRVQVAIALEAGAAVITVKDSGIGIAPEDLDKVKTKFYKGNSTRRGSGIGLAVADEIVMLHGGSLTLDSTQGEGTIVTISLPLKPQNEEETEQIHE